MTYVIKKKTNIIFFIIFIKYVITYIIIIVVSKLKGTIITFVAISVRPSLYAFQVNGEWHN